MKKYILGVTSVCLLSLTGCAAKLTGPGSDGMDLSKMKLTETACFIYVLGFGPYDNAVLKNKADAIQYSYENYVVWGRLCAEGYTK